MKRKLVKQGGSALTITLPAGWIRRNELKQGDEVDLAEAGKTVTVNAGGRTDTRKEASIQIDDSMDRVMLNRYMEEFYARGVEQITLSFKRDMISYHKEGKEQPLTQYAHQLIERFIGLEITSQTPNRIVIQSMLAQDDPGKMESVQHRIRFLIQELCDQFLMAMDGDFAAFNASVYDRHDTIAKFIIYLERIIRESEMDEQEKTRLLILYAVTSKIMDKLRHTSEKLAKKKKVSPRLKKTLTEIFKFYPSQFDIILKKGFSLKEMDDMLKRRYDLVARVDNERFDKDELDVIAECKIMLDTILEFMQAFAAKDAQRFIQPL